ncbi:YbaB/EbfC family nucleoid-associated protein [Nonomuraea africana]|uniref:DNA-binding protein YbaB n=1 Tax=Nonomuraea africana TaxID=46171 RepID=A0ABR9KM23_9ACTN|nr:YbaB/EbfC family nucleoid-associated protein [Nonomuraea africana]MBE1562617.1 DNA-binding protein YbaB [Nonomuraea africana]
MKQVNSFHDGREGDLGGLLREVGEWTGALAGALRDLAEERLSGSDSAEVVRAEVSGEGRLLGLSIDPRGLRDLDHVQLSEAVQEAIVVARIAMGGRLTEVMAELAGPAASAETGRDPLEPYIKGVLGRG